MGCAALGCCVLVAVVSCLTSSSVGPSLPSPPHPSSPQLSIGRESMPVREGVLSSRLNAESIQLHHPPLHLTFQGTHISSLRCQTFSTCYFALVPYVNSFGVSGGWAGRSGSTKVDAKMGMRVRLGPTDCHPLLTLSASAHDDAVSESKKVVILCMCQNHFQWSAYTIQEKKSVFNSLLQVITFLWAFSKTQNIKDLRLEITCIHVMFFQHLKTYLGIQQFIGYFKTAIRMTAAGDNECVREDKKSDEKSTDTWNSHWSILCTCCFPHRP